MEKAMWYENYGWKSNPFVIDPIPDTFIIDDIRSKVVESIYSGDILNLYGQTGTGKTSLLHMLEKSLAGEFVPVFIDSLDLANYAPNSAPQSSRQYEGFLNKLKRDALKAPSARLRKILGHTLLENLKSTYKNSKLVLLIDEAKDISDPTIPSYFRSIKNSGANCAIVMTSIDPVSTLEVFKDSLREVRVSYLQMRKIDLDEAKLMLNKRISNVGGKGTSPFDEKKLKYLIKVSNYTPITILKNAEDALKSFSSKGNSGEMTIDDIAAALMESSPRPVRKAEEAMQEEMREADAKADEAPIPAKAEIPFDNLTPTQQKIVRALRKSAMTSEELCKELGVKYGVVYPEIYRLMLMRDTERMRKKGIEKPILSKTKDKPAKYILDAEWRLGLVKE